MNALHIVFKTGCFNLSQVKDHFINPCCFGEDLAAWLRARLTEEDVETREPYQEDWGWELPVQHGHNAYYLCLSGNSEAHQNLDYGEWRIIVEKRRTLWQHLCGKGKITAADPMLILLQRMLSAESAIRDVRLLDDEEVQRAY